MNVKSHIRVLIGSNLRWFPVFRNESNRPYSSALMNKLGRSVKYAQLHRSLKTGNEAGIEKAHFNVWKDPSTNNYYDQTTYRFEENFIQKHQSFIDAIRDAASKRRFERIVEVGCGDGQVLEFLSQVLDIDADFVGLDINKSIIDRNQLNYSDNIKTNYIFGDATMRKNLYSADNTLLFTYGGVFEYFSKDSILEVFSAIAKGENSAIALLEPIDHQHDLEKSTESYSFGSENSFSHNYLHLMKLAGLKVEFIKDELMSVEDGEASLRTLTSLAMS